MPPMTIQQRSGLAVEALERRLRSLGIKIPRRRRTAGGMSLIEAMAAFDAAIAALDAWLDALVPIREAITEAVGAMRAVMADAMNKVEQ